MELFDSSKHSVTRREMLKILGSGGISLLGIGLAPVSQVFAAGEKLTVSALRSTVNIGQPIVFSGKLVNSSGKPMAYVSIYAEDPIKQQCLPVAKTDNNGLFSYSVDGYRVSKAGKFNFKFNYSSIWTPVSVFVQAVNPSVARSAIVSGNGRYPYTVDVFVDGRNMGRKTINPYQGNVSLWQSTDANAHSLKLVCINKSNGKTATFTPSLPVYPVNVPQSCTTANPTFQSYYATLNSTVINNTTARKSSTISGVASGIYENVVNKDYGVGGDVVKVSTNTKHGINADAGVSGGAQCSTFLGIQASCSFTCEAGVGLSVKVCAGLCIPLEPGFDFGCGFKCGVDVAKVSCSVGAEVKASATYKL